MVDRSIGGACSPSPARSSRPACTASVASALVGASRRRMPRVSMHARVNTDRAVRPDSVLRSADGRIRRTGSGGPPSAAAAAERRPDHLPGPRRAGRGRAVHLPGPGDPAAPLRRDPRAPAAAGPGQAGPRPAGAAVGAGAAAPAGAGRPVRGADPGAAGVADRVPPDRPRRLSGACGGRGHGGPAAAGARRVHLAARGGAGGDAADLPAVGLRPAAAAFAARHNPRDVRRPVVPGWSACHHTNSAASPPGRRRLRRRAHRPRPDHRHVPRRARRAPAGCPTSRPPARRRVAELRGTTLARLDEAERAARRGQRRRAALRPAAAGAADRRTRRARGRRAPARGQQHGHARARGARGVHRDARRETEEDWAAIAERLRASRPRSPGTGSRWRWAWSASCYAGPRPTATFVGQLTEWADTDGEGRGWFEDFAAGGPDALRAELDEAAARRRAAVASCATGCATCTRPPSRARRTRWAASATPAGRATTTAPTWTWTRRTRTAGPSTTGCWAR